ncbi:MAG: DUF2628 domain-containing protein [Ruminococcus sp.]|nr:DUF2628 domain-containing protein [Ruminococcus sp.]
MGKYDGCKCLSCGLEFTEFDDVVVCPECGTPYHRDCYEKEGQCINTDLHESGGTWKPEHKEAHSEGPVRCVRCGQENPAEGLFCNRCGMPLNDMHNNEPRPFNENGNAGQRPGGMNNGGMNGMNGMPGQGMNGSGFAVPPNAMRFDQDSDIDGVKLGDLARYVGRNQFSFLTSFIRFGKFGGKASLNFCALLFPQYYFFYRKMNLIGIIYLIGSVILSLPTIMLMSAAGYLPKIAFVTESFVKSSQFSTILNFTSTALMATQCISAIFANYWYYKTARKNIKAVRDAVEDDEEMVRGMISSKGGVSWRGFFLAVLISNALVVFAVFMMNKLAG